MNELNSEYSFERKKIKSNEIKIARVLNIW